MPKIVILGSCKFEPYEILIAPNKLNPELYKTDHEKAYEEACRKFNPAIDICDEVWVYAPDGVGEHTRRDVEYAESKGKLIRYLCGVDGSATVKIEPTQEAGVPRRLSLPNTGYNSREPEQPLIVVSGEKLQQELASLDMKKLMKEYINEVESEGSEADFEPPTSEMIEAEAECRAIAWREHKLTELLNRLLDSRLEATLEGKKKPLKGWTYRITVCDGEGNLAFDDVKVHGKPTHKVLDRLIAEVIAKKCGIPEPKDYAFTHVQFYCDEVELPDEAEQE